MAKIKAAFKGVTEADKKQFKHSSCLLTISVGQAYHEGELFAATVELVKKSFKSCIILLGDSLQRHTLALDKTQDADYFHNLAIEQGNDWLKRNEKYYKNLNNLLEIIRWDELLNDRDFNRQRNKIIEAIQQDKAYENIFKEAIAEYLSRYSKRFNNLSNFDYERAQQISYNYLIEECAALCLWPKTKCHFQLYPSKHLAVTKETRKRFVHPVFPDLIREVTTRFNHGKGFTSPQFSASEQEEILLTT